MDQIIDNVKNWFKFNPFWKLKLELEKIVGWRLRTARKFQFSLLNISGTNYHFLIQSIVSYFMISEINVHVNLMCYKMVFRWKNLRQKRHFSSFSSVTNYFLDFKLKISLALIKIIWFELLKVVSWYRI